MSRSTRISLICKLVRDSPAPSGASLNIGCKQTRLGDVRLDITGNPDVKGSVLALPFRSDAFSIAIFSEVLEHIPLGTETHALGEIRRILRDQGSLILSTPSSEGGWGKIYRTFDPAFWAIGHRHYTNAEVKRFLDETGFFVDEMTRRGGFKELLFAIVTPVAFVLRKIGLHWNPDLESDYSSDAGERGYTLMVEATKR